jgi:hypothetical protein
MEKEKTSEKNMPNGKKKNKRNVRTEKGKRQTKKKKEKQMDREGRVNLYETNKPLQPI